MACAAPIADSASLDVKPFVDGKKILLNGKVLPWEGDVQARATRPYACT